MKKTFLSSTKWGFHSYVGSSDWRHQFSEASVTNLSFSNSDHRPIRLSLFDDKQKGKKEDRHQFRFTAWWVKEIGCCEVIEAEWRRKDHEANNGLFLVANRLKSCGGE